VGAGMHVVEAVLCRPGILSPTVAAEIRVNEDFQHNTTIHVFFSFQRFETSAWRQIRLGAQGHRLILAYIVCYRSQKTVSNYHRLKVS
jgi:hypothetical protein